MKSVRAKLIAFIALPTLVVYVVILGGTMSFLRASNLAALERDMTRLASMYAARFDGFLREAAAVAETTARALALEPRPAEPVLYAQLRANVSHASFIYGAATAFEPGTVRSGNELFAPYVHRSPSGLTEMNIGREVYDWYADPQYTWFQEPKAKRRGVWSRPYFDEGAGNVLMTTYSAPFFVDSEFRGVTTVDIDLPNLRETIGAQIAETLDFVIVDGDGRFVFDPMPGRIMQKTLAQVSQETGNRQLAVLIPQLLSGNAGVAMIDRWDADERQWVFHAPIATAGWTFVTRTPEREAMADVRSRMLIAGLSLALTLILIVVCIAFVSSRLTRPLRRLTGTVRAVAKGDLEARVQHVATQDEIGALARDFNTMTMRLREHVERLAAEEATRQKFEYDLSIARDIQRGLLPVHQPHLPGYDLAGWSKPADQTGGDYYDWQTLPNGDTAITLADVTGHGIGPALVTAVCRAYARASFPNGSDVGRVLDQMNDLLCDDLQSKRFVTFVVALLEPAKHTVRLLSAGHGPLFYYRAAEDRVESFIAHNIPFGLAPEIGYGPPSVLEMSPGDALVLITDGFFEWPNAAGDQFGIPRVEAAIRAAANGSATDLVQHLYAEVQRFVTTAVQPDDLTAVVLKRTKRDS
jgi:sigma-B regulation protein RsbU (phosphoserine phosphatase)